MKFRTDFVTNSSSSSFIAVKVVTSKGEVMEAAFESGAVDIDPEAHDGCFLMTADDFESIRSGSELFDRVFGWFFESLEDPDCGKEEVSQALENYGSGDFPKIRKLDKKDIQHVAIYSREEYWDEPWGASLIEYDYPTKTRMETVRDKMAFDEEDRYGEELYDWFREGSNNDMSE